MVVRMVVMHSPSWTMVMKVMMMILLCASGPGRCGSPNDEYDYDYIGEGDDCHPMEADYCFEDVNDSLLCNLGQTKANKGRNCTKRDAADLCKSMGDALNCTEDILDTCPKGEGLDSFKVWHKGMKGVHQHLCYDERNLKLVNTLLTGSKCFRLKRFITCVEERTNLTHMADLLTTHLDLHECNTLQVSMAACIENSEKNRKNCQGTTQAATKAVTAFFTYTACGHLPPPTTPPPPPPTPPPPPPPPPCSPTTAPDATNNTNNNNTTTTTTTTTTTNNNNNNNNTNTYTAATTSKYTRASSPTASTVVVTMLVTLVLVGLTAALLLKKGVIAIRADLNRRLVGLNDDDGNTGNTGYDRF